MEVTIYERRHPSRAQQANAIAIGRIVAVDVTTRTCRVKTIYGPPGIVDLDLPSVQWASADKNSDGDEMGGIPRIGTMGMVFFIEGEAYFWGCVNALNTNQGFNKAPVTGNEASKLVMGDKILSTKAGNRVVVKSNGLVELYSKATLSRTMLPTDSRIQDICRNYVLDADGGYHKWFFDALGFTLSQKEYRTDLLRTAVLREDRGNVGGLVIYRDQIGAGGPAGAFLPLYTKEIESTGKVTESVGTGVSTWKETRNPEGAFAGEYLGDFSVKSSLGNHSVDLAVGSASVKASAGSITHEAGQNVSVQATAGNLEQKAVAGSATFEGSQAKLKLDKGKVALGGPTGELLDVLDQFLDAVKNVFDALAQETHVGNLGYPTSPPTNAAMYTQGSALVTQLKTILGTFKGSL